MTARSLRRLIGTAAVLVVGLGSARATSSYFAYISDHRVITVEIASRNQAVLNVINLSDETLVIHPYDLLLKNGARAGTGQVFQRDAKESGDTFFATQLINPREFIGLTVV